MTEILSMKFSGDIRKAARWHLLAGVLMIVLGLCVWFNPLASLLGLALYIGIAFLLVGAGYLTASFSFRSGWFLLVGLLLNLFGNIWGLVFAVFGGGAVYIALIMPLLAKIIKPLLAKRQM